MKSKAKPAKGSARTKRFDVGGTVGALAGLGTLAYLMSRKKKGAAGAEGPEFKPQGKFPSEAGSGTSGPGMADTTTKVDDAAQKRALDQSKNPKLNLVPEGADKDVLYESDKALVRTDKNAPPAAKKKPAPPPAAKPKTGQGSSTTTGVDAGIAAGKAAADKKAAEKAAADKKAAEKAAAEKNKNKKPGDNTFITKERSEQANKAMGNAWRAQNPNLAKPQSEKFKDYQGRNAEYNKMLEGFKNKKAGGAVKSASARADGIAIRGKTRA